MACEVALADRTAVEIALEHQRDPVTCALIPRTRGHKQIPLYNNPNPLSHQATVNELNRIKPSLDPDFGTVTDMQNRLSGMEFFEFGSGIANLPPDHFDLLEMSGFGVARLAVHACPTSQAISATPSETGAGAIAEGDYRYGYTMLVEANGTTPATTRADAVYETNLDTNTDDVTVTAPENTVTVTGLPSTGIKRVYRTKVDDTTGRKYLVGEVADGATSIIDELADFNLDAAAPINRASSTATPTATGDNSAGGLDSGGVYGYKYTTLHDINGAVVTDSDAAYYEGVASAAFTVDLSVSGPTPPNTSAAIASLPSAGVKRIYRTVGGGANYFFLREVAHGTTGFVDQAADSALGDPLLAHSAAAVYRPLNNFNDFKAGTLQTYLDTGNMYPTTGARGSLAWDGTVGQNLRAVPDILGVFNTTQAFANPVASENPDDPPVICGAELVISRDDGTDRTPIWTVVGINLARTPALRRDGNAPCAQGGIKEVSIATRPNPRFTLTLESQAVEWVGEFKAQRKYSFEFHIGGNTVGRRVYFGNKRPWGSDHYVAQQIEPPGWDRTEDGQRANTLTFKLAGNDRDWLTIEHR
jgi:hypothetical protein